MREYAPDRYTVQFLGQPISGFAEDTFVSIAPESQLYDDVVGADGEITRFRVLDERHTATITLMATSESNAVFSAAAKQGKQENNGADVGVFEIAHLDGETKESFGVAWVREMPTSEYGRNIGERAWVIRLGQPNRNIVGHPRIG